MSCFDVSVHAWDTSWFRLASRRKVFPFHLPFRSDGRTQWQPPYPKGTKPSLVGEETGPPNPVPQGVEDHRRRDRRETLGERECVRDGEGEGGLRERESV